MKTFLQFLRLLAGLALAATGLAKSETTVPSIIFDTDFRSDCDDVGSLAALHALQDQGKANLIGAIATTTGNFVVGAIDAMNTYYGRADIPIGIIVAGGGLNTTRNSDEYAPVLANTWRFVSDQTNVTAPISTGLYRQLLHNAADGSVKIVVVGAQTAINRLMESTANQDGDGIGQTGQQLIAAKVTELVIMGGHFKSATFPEFNITLDAVAAQQVARHWPTRIVYSGYEIGDAILTGGALTNPERNPVAKAYEAYSGTAGGAGVIGDRRSWDQTAVLHAVLGTTWNDRQLWQLSEPHIIDFAANGATIATPSPGANRYFIIQSDALMTNAEIESVISGLMTAEPENPGPLPEVPVPIGTLAHWRFNEGVGSTAADVSGRGHGGTLKNIANPSAGAGDTTTSGWTSGGRLRFDGTNDHVETSLPLSQIRPASFTLEAVVKYDGPANRGWTPIFGSSHNPYSAGEIFFVGKNNGTDGLNINFAGMTQVNIANTGLFNGQEHHLAIVFDVTVSELRVYVDNVLKHTRPNVTGSFVGTSNLLIGATGHGINERWLGWFGQVRVSDDALAPSDFFGMNPTAFEIWATDRELAGQDALPDKDPDGNGVSNLLEFAFGIGDLPGGLDLLPQPNMEIINDSLFLTLGFRRRTGNAGISYFPEFGNLSPRFGDTGLQVGGAAPSQEGFEYVTYRDVVEVSSSARRFGRIRVANN